MSGSQNVTHDELIVQLAGLIRREADRQGRALTVVQFSALVVTAAVEIIISETGSEETAAGLDDYASMIRARPTSPLH